MFNLIIAEDEPKISALISEMIDTRKLNVSITGIFNNGQEAFEYICESFPDIVLTDIRMPGLDGIELIQKTKERGIDSSFIIISGYDLFEYARAALQNEVSSYILKPIEKPDLNDAIRKAIATRTARALMQNELSHNQKALKDTFMEKIIYKECKDVYTLARKCNLKVDGQFSEILLIHFDESRVDKDLISKEASEIFKDSCCEYVVYEGLPRQLLCFLNYHTFEGMQKPVDELYTFITRTYPYDDILVTVGKEVSNIEKIRQSMRSSYDAALWASYHPRKGIVAFDRLQFSKTAPVELMSKKEFENVAHAAEIYDAGTIHRLIDRAMSRVTADVNPDEIIAFFHSIYHTVCDSLYKDNSKVKWEELEKVGSMHGVLCTISDMETSAKDYISEKFDEAKSDPKLRGHVAAAKKFIDTNYKTPISLEEVAQNIHINSSYLSTIFKNELGTTFTEYVMQKRISEAKILLTETNTPISKIGEMVGYNDNRYFSRLFFQLVGVTPSKYRKIH